jgi:hypothetical protein
MNIRFLVAVAAALFFAFSGSTLSAQVGAGGASGAKPNFAGKWTLVPDTAASAQRSAQASALAGLGPEVTITHDDVAVTVSRVWNGVGLKSVLNLDGSESHNSLALGPDTNIPLTARSRWESNKLLTTLTATFGGEQFELTMNLSLDASGTLVVDMTTPPMGGAPGAFTMRYRKNQG